MVLPSCGKWDGKCWCGDEASCGSGKRRQWNGPSEHPFDIMQAHGRPRTCKDHWEKEIYFPRFLLFGYNQVLHDLPGSTTAASQLMDLDFLGIIPTLPFTERSSMCNPNAVFPRLSKRLFLSSLPTGVSSRKDASIAGMSFHRTEKSLPFLDENNFLPQSVLLEMPMHGLCGCLSI